MKRKVFFSIVTLFLGKCAVAQNLDTLVFTNRTIIAKIKEVTPELIAYQLPGNDVLYKLNKTDLVKVSYSDGRTEESRMVRKPALAGTEEWRNVSIAHTPEDVQGLYKIGEIEIRGTVYPRYKEAALKMKAAMMGGNVVSITNTYEYTSTRYYSYPINARSNHPTYYNSPRTSVYELIKANVYTSKLPDSVAFKKLVSQQPLLSLVGHSKLRTGAYKYIINEGEFNQADAKIIKYTVEDNNLFVWLNLKEFNDVKFHVNYFDDARIILSFKKYDWSKYHAFFLLIKPATLKNINNQQFR